MRRLIHLGMLLLAMTIADAARAACQVSTSEVAFGTIDIARGKDSTGEIRLTCALAASFEIALVGNGGPGARFMSGANGGQLVYDLFPDPTYSVPWGDGSGSGMMQGGSNDGSETSRLTIYGQVPVQSGVPAGAYSDSLTVVVTF